MAFVAASTDPFNDQMVYAHAYAANVVVSGGPGYTAHVEHFEDSRVAST